MPGSTTKATLTRRVAAAAVAAGALLAAGCTGTSSTQVEVSTPEEEVEATTTTLPPDCAEALPPAAQAAQMLMVMVTAPQNATEVLTAGKVGGFGLKGRQSSDVADEVADAVAGAPLKPFVASDEEGGTVQRLRLSLGDLPSAAKLADGTPEEAATELGDYAAEMVGLGFNMNFGPVADVGSGSDLGTRSFGDDPNVVADFTVAIVEAQQRAGIISVVKHWPGIGGGDSDPHLALDALAPVDALRAKDMVPFDRLIAAGVPAIMVAHSTVPGLTGEAEPASLSRAAITDELRGRQGFQGLVITDSLGMGAVVNTVAQDEAARRSIAAGADIALLSGTDVVEPAHQLLTEAITTGQIPAEQVTASVRRVLAAKGIEGECLGLVANYSALLQNAGDDGTTTTAEGQGDQDTGINSSDPGTGRSGTNSSGSGTNNNGTNNNGTNGNGTTGTATGSGSGTSSSSTNGG
ncbi:MAG: hypothetical protein M3Y51_00235 [Actinomycetota bacterium]|nr:hypothetical protein [Actinomycetota bacterium]